jgi:hypothetical protein
MIWLPTGTIDNNQVLGKRVDDRGDRESDSERVLLMNSHSEEPGDPCHRMPPEAPEEGQNSKLSNLMGAKFFRKRISISSLLVS